MSSTSSSQIFWCWLIDTNESNDELKRKNDENENVVKKKNDENEIVDDEKKKKIVVKFDMIACLIVNTQRWSWNSSRSKLTHLLLILLIHHYLNMHNRRDLLRMKIIHSFSNCRRFNLMSRRTMHLQIHLNNQLNNQLRKRWNSFNLLRSETWNQCVSESLILLKIKTTMSEYFVTIEIKNFVRNSLQKIEFD